MRIGHLSEFDPGEGMLTEILEPELPYPSSHNILLLLPRSHLSQHFVLFRHRFCPIQLDVARSFSMTCVVVNFQLLFA